MWALLEQLRLLCEPPKAPKDRLDDTQWNAIFRALGTRLPEELVQINKCYGTGFFESRANPVNASFGLYTSGVAAYAVGRLRELREAKLKRAKSFPCSLYFEPGGILPIGWCSTNIDICLRAHNWNPDQWKVTLLKSTVNVVEHLDVTVLEFLVGLMSGEIKSELLPAQLYPSRKGYSWQQAPGSVKC